MDIVNKNIIANYIGKLWGFISIFIFIRFYIEILGIQAYAIINFYSVILGLIAFADAGLTATLNRELAKDISVQDKLNLVYTSEKIYLGISIFVFILIYGLSDYIAQNFLKTDSYSRAQISYYIKLIGVGISLQLFSTLYEGGLMGLQKQVLSNKIKIVWSLFRSGIVIIPLLYFPTLEVYFIWQILSNIILLFVFKQYIAKELITLEKPIFSKKIIINIWRYALGMMGIAFISAINIQIDKLVTSKYLDLKSFGYYSLATTIAQIPLLVATPIIVAVFPILSMLVSKNDFNTKKEYYHKFSFIITLITAPIAVCIFLYTIPLIVLWTGDIEIANQINIAVKILIFGGFFLCLQLMPYYLSLANGHTKTNIIIGIVGLFIIIPLVIYSVKKFGLIGATLPWFFINLLSLLVLSIVVLNKFLPNEYFNWLKKDVVVPLVVTLLVATGVYLLALQLVGKYWFIIEMSIIFTLSLFVNLLLYNKLNPANKLIDFNLLKERYLKR